MFKEALQSMEIGELVRKAYFCVISYTFRFIECILHDCHWFVNGDPVQQLNILTDNVG